MYDVLYHIVTLTNHFQNFSLSYFEHIPLQIDTEIVPQTKTTMPVQRLKEPLHTSDTLEEEDDKFVRPKISGKTEEQNDEQKQIMNYNEVYSNNLISNPVVLETNNPPAPVIPERTSASNLKQLGPNRNYGLMRKTSYQSERVVPNDDLAISRARAAGARKFSPRVCIKKVNRFTLY